MRRLRRLNYAVTVCMILQTGCTSALLRQALHQYWTRLYDASETGEYVDDVTTILLGYLSDVSKQIDRLVTNWESRWEFPLREEKEYYAHALGDISSSNSNFKVKYPLITLTEAKRIKIIYILLLYISFIFN